MANAHSSQARMDCGAAHFDRDDRIQRANCCLERRKERILVWEDPEVARLDPQAHSSGDVLF